MCGKTWYNIYLQPLCAAAAPVPQACAGACDAGRSGSADAAQARRPSKNKILKKLTHGGSNRQECGAAASNTNGLAIFGPGCRADI